MRSCSSGWEGSEEHTDSAFRFYLRLFSYFQTILRQNLLFLVAVILMLDVFYDHVKLIYLSCGRSSLERKKNLMRDGQRYTEYGKGEHKWITNNALGGAKIYWVQCSLPQAQVFYIFSRNKFILVKTTNLSLFPFMPQLYSNFNVASQSFRSPPDPAWQRKQLRRAQVSALWLGMSRTAANHVEEHFDDHSDDRTQ